MRFSLIFLISISVVACSREKSGDGPLMKASPKDYSIGNENPADRSLQMVHVSMNETINYYAEFMDKIEDKNNRGWRFTLYDDRTGKIASTLNVYRLRLVNEMQGTFDAGQYFTLRQLTAPDSMGVVVQLQSYPKGIAFRANQKKPGNYIKVESFSGTHDLLTFNLEAGPDVGTQELVLFKGRFLIKRD